MIRRLSPIKFRNVKRISPSQFYDALQCPYKLILAESNGYRPLISLSPNAYFGSVAHKMIELMAKRVIYDLTTFEHFWCDLIQKKETELVNEGLFNMVPLKSQIKDIGLKKIHLQKLIVPRSTISPSGCTSLYKAEMPLFDDSGKIFGKADLVYDGSDYVEIYDFKTGEILKRGLNEEGGITYSVKVEYEYQLKLYAYLYFLRAGRFPDKLYLISVDKSKVEVPCNIQECKSLYQQAINFLDQLGRQFESGDLKKMSRCSESNCRFCMYRPACEYYRDWLLDYEAKTNDVSGILKSFKVFPSGDACAYIKDGNNTRIISGLSRKDEVFFINSMNKSLTFFNVKKDKGSINMIITKSTTVYEYS